MEAVGRVSPRGDQQLKGIGISMGKFLSAAFRWLLQHPEVAQAVAEAVTAHNKGKKKA
jgi:hypothetical protein